MLITKERKFSKIDEETNEEIEFEMTPTNTTKNYRNEQCREYKYQFTKNGETYFGSGTACLDANGTWAELYHENG